MTYVLECPKSSPPTQLVDRSYSAYKGPCHDLVRNPTNAVGGLFILSLQGSLRNRASGIPATQLVDVSYSTIPSRLLFRPCMNNPPTLLVGFKTPRCALRRLDMNNPPTALVGFCRAHFSRFRRSA